ncbi:MAG: hypothetical protein MUC57_13430, partial [Desulfobacterales bacterium]|nr:hypothetical protein [Desulfobacterales bacterium]
MFKNVFTEQRDPFPVPAAIPKQMRFEIDQRRVRNQRIERFQGEIPLVLLRMGADPGRLPQQRLEEQVLRVEIGDARLQMRLVPSADDAQQMPAHELVVRMAARIGQKSLVAEIRP